MVLIIGCGVISAQCTPSEKAVVRTVVDIAKLVCTEQDTVDACVDKILAERRAEKARTHGTP